MSLLKSENLYSLLSSKYGRLRAEMFSKALLDGRGNTDFAAMWLWQWILDWHRPAEGGGSRFAGQYLTYTFEQLSELFGYTEWTFRTAKRAIKKAGFAEFKAVLIEGKVEKLSAGAVIINWSNVEKYLRDSATLPAENHPPVENHRGGVVENHRGGVVENHRDTSSSPSFSPTPSGVPELKTEQNVENPPAKEEEEEENSEKSSEAAFADRLIAFGAERGRACYGKWAQSAREAVKVEIEKGRDPEAIEAAWKSYIGVDGAKCVDLGHWLRGQGLDGNPRNLGKRSYEALYAVKKAKKEKKAEAKRVAAGGVPTDVRFYWEGQSWQWIASLQNNLREGGTLLGLVESASKEERREAFEAAWRAAHGGESQN